MKEAAAALKEEADELSGKAASTSKSEPATEAEMVFAMCIGMLAVHIRGGLLKTVTSPAQVEPTVSADALQQLEAMGFSKTR